MDELPQRHKIIWCEHERCRAVEARFLVKRADGPVDTRIFHVCGRHLTWGITWATADSPKISALVYNVRK